MSDEEISFRVLDEWICVRVRNFANHKGTKWLEFVISVEDAKALNKQLKKVVNDLASRNS